MGDWVEWGICPGPLPCFYANMLYYNYYYSFEGGGPLVHVREEIAKVSAYFYESIVSFNFQNRKIFASNIFEEKKVG